ncbi:hypothetical protein EGH22_05595 [Halomicroarcula sp. F28]|uniref:hypothetical protein n=1 Tax=Haloarcula salinisoli TaxID=2487746 RepID=UPI001C732944|nr:hypothetical protein [Halomicroarcula salinisoli]MBX0285790.1 hypothetical protein [Halomicroarcula salinisoli]
MANSELKQRWADLRDRPSELTQADINRTLELIGPETDAGIAKAVLNIVEDMSGYGLGYDPEGNPWDGKPIRPRLFACLERILRGPYDPALRQTAGEKLVSNAKRHSVSAAESGVLELFVDLLSDDDPAVRVSAGNGLSTMADETGTDADDLTDAGAVSALYATRDDADPRVRSAIYSAAHNAVRWTDLDSRDRERTLEILTTGIDDPDPDVRADAISLLRTTMNGDVTTADLVALGAVEAVRDRLEDDADEVVVEACRLFGWIAMKTEDGVSTLDRVSAVPALCAVIDRTTDPPPAQVEFTEPVGAAVKSLGQIGAESPALVEPALPQMIELPLPAEVGTTAVPDAIGTIAGQDLALVQSTIADVEATMREGTVEERKGAVRTVGAIGRETPTAVQPVLDSLVALLDDSDTDVRTETAVAITDIARVNATLVEHTVDPLLDALLAVSGSHSVRELDSAEQTDAERIAKAIEQVVDGETDTEPSNVVERVVEIATSGTDQRQRDATTVLWAFVNRSFTRVGSTPLVYPVDGECLFDPLEELLSHPDGYVRTTVACTLLRLDSRFSAADAEGAREVVRARLRLDDPIPDDALWNETRKGQKVRFATVAVGMLDQIAGACPERVEPLEPVLEAATDGVSPIVTQDTKEILDRLSPE